MPSTTLSKYGEAGTVTFKLWAFKRGRKDAWGALTSKPKIVIDDGSKRRLKRILTISTDALIPKEELYQKPLLLPLPLIDFEKDKDSTVISPNQFLERLIQIMEEPEDFLDRTKKTGFGVTRGPDGLCAGVFEYLRGMWKITLSDKDTFHFTAGMQMIP